MTHQLFGMAGVAARRWHGAALIVIALLIGALAAPFALAAPGAQTDGVLRIGYLGKPGSETANGAQLAIDQINSIGGVTAPDGTAYRLALVTLASAPTVDTLGDAIDELIAQDVAVLLGPDTNALITADTVRALAASGLPVLTGATGDALTDLDVTDRIFRIRAPERVLSAALATYLARDLGLKTVVAVQTEVEFTEALIDFENALSASGVRLADRVQLPGGDTLLDEVPDLLDRDPDAVVMWGTYRDAAALLAQLRGSGWDGVFAYRKADEAARARALPDALANGVLGVDTWSYGDPLRAAGIFLRDYVVAFGEVPGPLAVAAYDAMWYLRFAVADKGAAPTAIQAGLIDGDARTLVHGVLHPRDFANGDLARAAVVYQLGPRGGPSVLARFDDTQRIALDQAGPAEPTPVPPTPTPTLPAVPTATLEGTWIEVTVNTLNVRSGPGFDYEKIGEAKLGERYRVLGAVADYSWLVIDFKGGVAWVKAEYAKILGDLVNVSIVQPPTGPVPVATPTLPLSPNADIVIDAVALDPAQPIPGRPFTATVTVRNAGGGAAGRFAVAATWEPGSVYTSSFVEGLAGGQAGQVQLGGTLVGTGVFQVAVVADLNNEVAEDNENNNQFTINYRADYPLLTTQTSLQINAGTTWDLFGGAPDFEWNGYNLSMRNGAQIGQVSGVTYENAHFDLLAPGAIVYDASGFGPDKVTPGAVLAMITAEGKRAALRVDNLQGGGPIWLSYRVYNDTP